MLSRILSQQKVYSRHIQISGICGKLFKEDKEGNQGTWFFSQRLWSYRICNWGIEYLFQALQYIFKLLCCGGFHHYGNPGLERPHVLAVDYKENAENQQINLLQSSRFGEAMRWHRWPTTTQQMEIQASHLAKCKCVSTLVQHCLNISD